MSALRTAPAPLALAVAFAVTGCAGSSGSKSSTVTSTAAQITAAPAAGTAPTTTPAKQPRTHPKAAARAVRRPRVIHQPRTRPTPTPGGELTRFQVNLGTAFGTFRRYVYTPFKTGRLVGNEINTAGSATFAMLHNVVDAKDAAGGGTAVRTLFASLAALTATSNELATKLDRGQLDSAGIKSVNGQIDSIERDAAAAGVPIRERAPRSAPSGAPISDS